MARHKTLAGASSQRAFTFLSDAEDLELSRTMEKVVEKIEIAQYNSEEAKLKRKKEEEEKIQIDPMYDYKWWERSEFHSFNFLAPIETLPHNSTPFLRRLRRRLHKTKPS